MAFSHIQKYVLIGIAEPNCEIEIPGQRGLIVHIDASKPFCGLAGGMNLVIFYSRFNTQGHPTGDVTIMCLQREPFE